MFFPSNSRQANNFLKLRKVWRRGQLLKDQNIPVCKNLFESWLLEFSNRVMRAFLLQNASNKVLLQIQSMDTNRKILLAKWNYTWNRIYGYAEIYRSVIYNNWNLNSFPLSNLVLSIEIHYSDLKCQTKTQNMTYFKTKHSALQINALQKSQQFGKMVNLALFPTTFLHSNEIVQLKLLLMCLPLF